MSLRVMILVLAIVVGTTASTRIVVRLRELRPARGIFVASVAMTAWSGTGLVMALTSDVTVERLAFIASFPMSGTAAASVLWYGLAVSRPRTVRNRALRVLIVSEPVLIGACLLVPAWHDAMASVVEGPSGPVVLGGPLLNLHAALSGGMTVLGTLLLIGSRERSAAGFRRRLTFAAVVVGLPSIAIVATVVNRADPLTIQVVAATTFTLVGLFALTRPVGAMEFGAPIGPDDVLSGLEDAVLVIDVRGVVVQANAAARELLDLWVCPRMSTGRPSCPHPTCPWPCTPAGSSAPPTDACSTSGSGRSASPTAGSLTSPPHATSPRWRSCAPGSPTRRSATD